MSEQLAIPENLWPTDFGEIEQTTPVSILREQGKALGQRTKNIVVGKVDSQTSDKNRFRHLFILYCRPLSYRVDLLIVEHGVDLYPAEIVIDRVPIKVENAEVFSEKLKEIFAREQTKKIIASLIAQSKQ